MSTNSVLKSDVNDTSKLINEFLSSNDYFTPEESEKIQKAWKLLVDKARDKTRLSGEPYYLHPLRVAQILASNRRRHYNCGDFTYDA